MSKKEKMNAISGWIDEVLDRPFKDDPKSNELESRTLLNLVQAATLMEDLEDDTV